jgi:Cu/Zn superoxide dismutase
MLMRTFVCTSLLGLLGWCATEPVFAQDDHVLISEFVVTPTAGEFIEIFNPTSRTIDLSRYYLTDDVTSNNNDYVKIVNGASALSVSTADFLVKFPEGASLGPHEAQTIAFSDTAFRRTYGISANYEIFSSTADVPDMTPIVVRANAGLTNAGETIVFFTWDGASDLVQDVDYVVWGNKTAAVDKSGLEIDGPDADTSASTYRNDTPVANQTVVNADNDGDSEPHNLGESAQRVRLEAGETLTGGNGLTGHNETSENLSFAGGSWASSAAPTPGSVPEALKRMPAFFMATLNGEQVLSNPPATGIGGGFFILTEEQNALKFYLSLNGLSAAVVSAHFHNAAAGNAGAIVRTITNEFQGEVASGEWKSTDSEPLTAELAALLLAGGLYVDIHTAFYPEGEIRGQVLPGSEKNFAANLTGAQEVPPVMTTAYGTGNFTLDANGSQLSFDLTVSGLSGPIAGAHFHNAPNGVNGIVVRDLAASFIGNNATGAWADTNAQALTPGLVAELLAEKIYVNVHTAANPNGEIRGQVLPNANAIMPIAVARQTANGTIATVEGIVTRAQGRFAHLQDATAGIVAFQSAGPFRAAIDSGLVRMGDRLRITGTLTEFNSLKEFSPIDNFEVLSRDHPLPAPQLVTLAEIASNGEAYESELIRVEGLTIMAGADTVFAPGRTYAITDASDQSGGVALRTPAASDTRIAGVAIPKGTAAFEGVLGQFSSSNPAIGYQLSPVLAADVSLFTGVEEQSMELPERFALLQNYPNPFNPTTVIRYALPRYAHVKLIIYNVLGKRVRTLIDANETPGFKQVTWNGANDAGKRAASGIYFYRLEAAGFRAAHKLALLK